MYMADQKDVVLQMQWLLRGLTEDERSQVYGAFSGEFYFLNLLMQVRPFLEPEADYSRPPLYHNRPFRQVLADFQNKKSKRVSVSREELLRRYPHLDPQQQLQVRKALLGSQSATDYQTAVRLCDELWSGAELTGVEALWERSLSEPKLRDLRYGLSRLLLRHASKAFLLEHRDALISLPKDKSGREMKVSSALYYRLLLRLPKEAYCREWLTMNDYYRLCYFTKRPVSAAEWRTDMYRLLAEIYVRCLSDLSWLPDTAPAVTSPYPDVHLNSTLPVHDLFSIERSPEGPTAMRLMPLVANQTVAKMVRSAIMLGFDLEINEFWLLNEAWREAWTKRLKLAKNGLMQRSDETIHSVSLAALKRYFPDEMKPLIEAEMERVRRWNEEHPAEPEEEEQPVEDIPEPIRYLKEMPAEFFTADVNYLLSDWENEEAPF